MEHKQPEEFQEAVGVHFTDTSILRRAFVHRSYLNESAGRGIQHNERVEFLGDAVLELAVTEFLYAKFPDEPEGTLTAYRAALVNTDSLSVAAARLSMDDYLLMSKGERMDTEKGRAHILANTFESFVGAVYLDQGYAAAQRFIADQLFDTIDEIVEKKLFKDAKSYFQEQAQEIVRQTPHYEVVKEVGPDHDKEFVMAVYLGQEKVAEGQGASKQRAETAAARAGLEAKGWV